MASRRLRRALTTGFKTGSGILSAQIQAARDEEERQRLSNKENLAALLGYSLVDERKARTEKLLTPEPEKSDIEYEIEIAPGFKAKTTSEEGLKKIAAGFGQDVGSFLGGVATGEDTGDVKIRGETGAGTVSGPYDQAAGVIESLGGIVPEQAKKPTDVYKIAERMAVNATGGDYGEWPDLTDEERLNYINHFAKQIWPQYNPDTEFRPLMGLQPEAVLPEGGTDQPPIQASGPNIFQKAWGGIKGFFGGGEEVPPYEGKGTPSVAQFAEMLRQQKAAGKIIRWDKIAAEHPAVDIEELKRMVGE
jgi:hypothetical protein